MRITGLAAPIQQMLLAALPKVPVFEAPEPPVPTSPQTTPGSQPVSVEMLVALAASESPIDRRRRVAVRADQALTVLERLNAELLAGLPVVERLQEVAAWTKAVDDDPTDPALAKLFKDIELRMRVELTKHDIIV
ncbi:MAG: flagellar assembly protein FliX [Sphingomonadaceae bacterium]